MSKTDLLLNCQYPFADDVYCNDPPGEPARYGSAFHELLASLLLRIWHISYAAGRSGARDGQVIGSGEVDALALKYKLPPSSVAPLADHVVASARVLCKWLEGENPWGVVFTTWANAEPPIIEKAFIIKPGVTLGQTLVRPTDLPDAETHHYDGLRKGEIAGTVDLLIGGLVLDHKTGHRDFSSPSDLGQLRTASLLWERPGVVVPERRYLAVLDADRRGIPAVYAERVEDADSEAHGKKLRAALRRINDGSMRPGPWCATCPALDDCPTKNNDLLARASALVVRASENLSPRSEEKTAVVKAPDVGWLHLLIAQFEQLAKSAKADIRAFVMAHPYDVVIRPDGKVLQFVDRKYTNLSQASILRAYGAEKGGRLIQKLKKDKAIEEGSRQELWALRDK
jgi:hypothetical protein